MPPSAIETVFERHQFFVSRETIDKLDTYHRLLEKWQKAINLVGPATLDDIPTRHFFDSAQMLRYIPNTDIKMVDLGSGAGFPGLVLAILGVKEVHLVESDVRKATFLREVSRETSTPVTVHDRRAEDVVIDNVAFVTARALAPLTDLLGFMHKIAPSAQGLFLKGLQHAEEIEKAQKKWVFTHETFPSETDLSGKIIRISGLEKK